MQKKGNLNPLFKSFGGVNIISAMIANTKEVKKFKPAYAQTLLH